MTSMPCFFATELRAGDAREKRPLGKYVDPLIPTAIGLAGDFLKNLGPRITYATTKTIPVHKAGGFESVGAYELRVRNDSRKKAEDITIHLRAGTGALRIEDYTVPQGLQIVAQTDNQGIKIPVPYLKPTDSLRLQLVAEGGYVPKSLDVVIFQQEYSKSHRIFTKPL